MRFKNVLFLHQPVTCSASAMFTSKYSFHLTKFFLFWSFCVSFRVLLLCFLLHLFHLFPEISAHNVTFYTSTKNRSFSSSKRQIDDLLSSPVRDGVLNGKNQETDKPIQPANNEQPFGKFIIVLFVNTWYTLEYTLDFTLNKTPCCLWSILLKYFSLVALKKCDLVFLTRLELAYAVKIVPLIWKITKLRWIVKVSKDTLCTFLKFTNLILISALCSTVLC